MSFREADLAPGSAYSADFTRLGAVAYGPHQLIIPVGSTTPIPLEGQNPAAAKAVATWTLRSHTGAIVATGGAISTGTAAWTSPVGLPCGWYRLYLYNGSGTYMGGGSLIVTRAMAGVPSIPASVAGDDALFVALGIGTYRNTVDNAGFPTFYYPYFDAVFSTIDTYKADTARPPRKFISFHQGWGPHAAGVTVMADHYRNVEYWEGVNEPNGHPDQTYIPTQQEFYNAVKAGNPSAKVLGPCPVTIGFNSWPTKAFFEQGGGAYCDVISFHTYNAHMGDLALGRRTWASWETILSDSGQQNKPRAITEAGGFFGAEYGGASYMRQASFTMLDLLLSEQHKVQKEDWFYFYARSNGFDAYPSWLVDGAKHPFPAVACLLTHTQELVGTTYESALDFGTIDNDYVIGSTYRNHLTTAGVVSLMSPGKRSHQVTLQVLGTTATSLTTVDCWGNYGTVPISGGLATVTIGGLPTYVRLPADAAATAVTTSRYGTRRETGGSVSCSAGSAGSTLIASLIDGTRPNQLFFSQNNGLQASTSVWQSGAPLTTTSPQTVTVTLPSAQRVSKVIVECPPAWQSALTVIRSATVEALVGGSWTQVGSITESPTVMKVLTTKQDMTNGYFESFDDETHIWEIDFTPVTASAVRLIVSSTTFGGVPTLTAYNAYGEVNYGGSAVTAGQGTATPLLALQRVSVFDAPQASSGGTMADTRLLEDGVSLLVIEDGASERFLEALGASIPPSSGNTFTSMTSRTHHGDTSGSVVLMSRR